VEALREKLAAAQNRRASLAPGARGLQAVNDEVEGLRKKLEDAQNATREVEQLRGSALRASADTQASLQRANDMLQRELDGLRGQLDGRDRELDVLRRQAEARGAAVRSTMTSVSPPRTTVRATMTSTSPARDARDRERDRELDAARRELDGRDRELDSLRRQLDGRDRELDVLRRQAEARGAAVRSTMTSVSPPRTGAAPAPYTTSPQKMAGVWGHPFSGDQQAPEAMQHPMHAPIPPEVTTPI
jgi:chromosome segregation ATPase